MDKIRYLVSRLIKKVNFASVLESSIHSTSKIEGGSQVIRSTFEKYSFCGYDCTIIFTKVGKYTSIASNVKIGLAQHPISWLSTSPVFYKGRDSVKKKFSEFERTEMKETIIGNDVWIGEGSFIKQGVIIGDGSIVGMGSVVTKDVEKYSVVAGNPAKLIRYRFPKATIERLSEIKWWNLAEEIIQKNSDKIQNVDEFIEEISK